MRVICARLLDGIGVGDERGVIEEVADAFLRVPRPRRGAFMEFVQVLDARFGFRRGFSCSSIRR